MGGNLADASGNVSPLSLPPEYYDVRAIALNRTGGDKVNIHGIHNPENAILNKKNESMQIFVTELLNFIFSIFRFCYMKLI